MAEAASAHSQAEELVQLRERLRKFELLAKKLKNNVQAAQDEAKQQSQRVEELTAALRATSGSSLADVDDASTTVLGRVLISPHELVVLRTLDGSVKAADANDIITAFPALKASVEDAPMFKSPSDVKALEMKSTEAGEALRNYRVRAEALLRQRDAELAAARERIQLLQAHSVVSSSGLPSLSAPGEQQRQLALGVESVDGNAGGQEDEDDEDRGQYRSSNAGAARSTQQQYAQQIQDMRVQIDKLLRSRSELLERDRASREVIAKLQRTTAAAGGAAGSSTSAMGVADLLSAAVSTPTPSSSHSQTQSLGQGGVGGAGGQHPAEVERDTLSAEYAAYRRRAVAMLKEKDESVKRLQEDLDGLRARLKSSLESAQELQLQQQSAHATYGLGSAQSSAAAQPTVQVDREGFRTPSKSRSGFESPASSRMGLGNSGQEGMRTPGGTPDMARAEYLRHTLVRYLAATDSSIKQQLEATMVALLRLSPAESLAIQKAKVETAGTLHGVRGAVAPLAPYAADLGSSIATAGGNVLSSVFGMLGSAANANAGR